MRVLIADDEPLARARLRRLLGRELDLTIVDECGDGRRAVEVLHRTAVDLLFLDIELPEMTGFEVLAQLGRTLPPTIFVTAYSQHAVRAFDVSAVDYLVKPVDGPRLALAVSRARERLAQKPEQRSFLERIPVRDGARIRFVDVSTIECVESQGNYVALWTGTRHELVRETISAMELRLDPRLFVRVHRRLIVRRDQILELTPSASGEFVISLRNGRTFLSGRTYRARIADMTRLGP